MSWENNRKKYHIAGLDGLRGIGVLGVILFHMFSNTWKGGYAGVLLFFVLSGYLLAYTSRRSQKSGGVQTADYYKKRVLRIFPPLIVVIFITAGFLKLFAPEVLIGIRGEVLSIFLGYNNIWQINQNASYFTRIANASPFTHLWFLAIEMQFYLIWPLFLMLYSRMRRGRWKKYSGAVVLIPAALSLMSLFINYVPGEDVTRVYYGTDTRIFSMFLGAYLGFCRAEGGTSGFGESAAEGLRLETMRRIRRIAKKWKEVIFAAFVLVLLTVYLLMDGETSFTYRVGLWAVSLLFCGAIWFVSDPGDSVGEMLDKTPLAWIGRKSYEIYLWQYPIIFLFQYHKKDRSVVSVVLMLLVITMLSLWTEFVLRWIREKIAFGGKEMKLLKKSVIGLLTVILMFAFVLGGCSLFTAANDDGEEQKQLESELEKNSKDLEEQQKKDEEQKDQTDQTDAQATEEPEEKGFITAIGDSVMLGAAPALQEAIPGCVVDAAESRQVVKAKETVQALKDQGKLGDTVILGLGTNGPFKTSVGQELLDAIGSDKTIYWVNVYGAHLRWQDDSNATISELAKQNPNVHIIDWASEAAAHPEWFYNDGIHLKPAGQKGYAQLMFRSVVEE